MGERRQYSAEYKAEAVKLVMEGGNTTAEAARSLGIPENLLRMWLEQHTKAAEGKQGLSATEQQELSRLREENKRLRMEHEILKKATAFFAEQPKPRPR